MPHKILVVDDEADIVELVSFNLQAAGYAVFTASSGTDALKKAQRHLPDLIVLDLMLPELDGIAICEILKKLPSTAQIPVLMLTSWATEESRIIGLQSGACDYVTKPFSPRELVTRIGKILKKPLTPIWQQEEKTARHTSVTKS